MSPMVVTKKQLSRRTVLRGVGTMIALPLLDAMVPAFAGAGRVPRSPRRLGALYLPNGVNMAFWHPKASGAFELSPTLQPLAPVKDSVVVVKGLRNTAADQIQGEGTGEHSRSSAAYLTGAHAKKTEGANIYAGISMDQIAAKEFGQHTQLRSLELGLEANELAGGCEHGYSCAYTGTISWASPQTPLPMETDPRAVFERMFGATSSTDREARATRIKMEQSILDAVGERLAQLQTRLGAGDRRKVNEYVESVRDIERRIQLAEEQSDRELPVVMKPASVPAAYDEYAKLMFDLWALAWQSDLTRVGTFMMGREKSVRSYPEAGIPDAHHPLSHHQGIQSKLELYAKLNTFHVGLLGHFLQKLQSTPEGDGNLLDSAIIVFGSGMSDGNSHSRLDLPVLVAGGCGGQIKGGRHVQVHEDTPLANLLVTVLNKAGIPADRVGDSTGKIVDL